MCTDSISSNGGTPTAAVLSGEAGQVSGLCKLAQLQQPYQSTQVERGASLSMQGMTFGVGTEKQFGRWS